MFRFNENKNEFPKAIYAHKLVDLFCSCGFECREKMRKKKLNIQFIFRLSVPPHIWKQDKKHNLCSYTLLSFTLYTSMLFNNLFLVLLAIQYIRESFAGIYIYI